MDKAKWLQFTKTLDIILTNYNIIHKVRINSKHGNYIEYVNNTWSHQWHKSTKKEYYALNRILKQKHKKLEEAQIKTRINNHNKAIDRGERKFITSLLNRDKRTI